MEKLNKFTLKYPLTFHDKTKHINSDLFWFGWGNSNVCTYLEWMLCELMILRCLCECFPFYSFVYLEYHVLFLPSSMLVSPLPLDMLSIQIVNNLAVAYRAVISVVVRKEISLCCWCFWIMSRISQRIHLGAEFWKTPLCKTSIFDCSLVIIWSKLF